MFGNELNRHHAVASGILFDVGMPVMHKNVVYNTRVVVLDGKILLIRPKLVLCDEDNYRETRWFTAWTKRRQTEDFYLPRFIRDVTGQDKARRTRVLVRLRTANYKSKYILSTDLMLSWDTWWSVS